MLEAIASELHEVRCQRDEIVAEIAPLDISVAKLKRKWTKTKLVLDKKLSTMSMGVAKRSPAPRTKKVKVQHKKRKTTTPIPIPKKKVKQKGSSQAVTKKKETPKTKAVTPKQKRMSSPPQQPVALSPSVSWNFKSFWHNTQGRKRKKFKCVSHTKRFLESDTFKEFQEQIDWTPTEEDLASGSIQQLETWKKKLNVVDDQTELQYWKLLTKYNGGVSLYTMFLLWVEK